MGTITVHVDTDEVLSEADDDEILAEMKARNLDLYAGTDDALVEIRRAIERKDWDVAISLFDRTFDVNGRPK